MTMTTFLYFVYLLVIVEAVIKLKNNGYEGVVVSITDKIPENPDLLSKIQAWLTEASRILYVASKYHVFLREITIQIPEHWTHNKTYTAVSKSQVKNFHLKIDAENPYFGKDPYVFGVTGCGQEGKFIHFTPDVILSGNNRSYGNLGIVFVHEWGHFRWGLFDEHPTVRDKEGKIVRFYLDRRKWEPVRCTKSVDGQILNDYTKQPCRLDSLGLPEPNCTFIAKASSDTAAQASIMGHTYLSTLTQFCDNNKNYPTVLHNEYANNMQNMKCKSKSSWEVMRQHSDFKDKSPGSEFLDTRPIFNFVHTTNYERLCLVIDVSGSMENLIRPTRDAAAALIKNTLPNNSYLAIVEFSGNATILKELTKITSESDRDNLITFLPSIADGATSIGAGLQKGYEVLSGLHNASGSIIYLLTDGQENTAPMIADIKPILEQNGVIVHALAITKSADKKIADIARSTGGLSFFSPEQSSNSTSLVDALSEPFIDTVKDPIIRVKSAHVSLEANVSVSEPFYIDDSVGRETTIQLTNKNVDGINLTVTHLDDVFSIEGKAQNHGVIAVKIPGKAKSGLYTVHILSRIYPVSGTLNIQSKASVINGDVLQMKTWTSGQKMEYSATLQFPIFVSLLRGSAPVTDAIVTAFVENEHGQTSSLILKDNAIGSDVIAGDGIYSGYILSNMMTANGRHSIKVTAEGYNSSVILPSSRSTGINDHEILLKQEPIGSFTRVALANEVVVTNYTIIDFNKNDVIPPSPILTLLLVEANNKNNIFTLTWTAVGDDFDSGKASAYDIRISNNFSSLVEDPDRQDVIPSKMAPKESGASEIFTFQLQNVQENDTYFVAVRAVDDYKNVGEMSNIVSVSVLSASSTWFESEPRPTNCVQLFDSIQNTLVLTIITSLQVMFI